MSTKNKKTNAWQIISAILAAITSVFSSLKRSHDQAHEDSSSPEE